MSNVLQWIGADLHGYRGSPDAIKGWPLNIEPKPPNLEDNPPKIIPSPVLGISQ